MNLPEWWWDYALRSYYRACGTWRWRFWFEVTGQGRAARRYERDIYGRRWWETKGRARRRTIAKMRRLAGERSAA